MCNDFAWAAGRPPFYIRDKEVKEMYEGRTNEGYIIVNAISVGNTEFVLGVHRKIQISLWYGNAKIRRITSGGIMWTAC